MTLDVLVPALRAKTIEALLESLSLNDVLPDAVSVVSNEIDRSLRTYGLPVRLLRFRSDQYPIGDCDVALRRDIGCWFTECTHVLLLDDDLIAPANLIASAGNLLAQEPFFWGHHRYLDFEAHDVEELSMLPASRGRSRETAPNRWHLWMSCYGGLFGAERQVVVDHGGFDIAFSGRCASEDQSLGRRLAQSFGHDERAFIHEPPFAWHPTNPSTAGKPRYTNLCGRRHRRRKTTIGGAAAERCSDCPWFRVTDTSALFGQHPLLPFDPTAVTVEVIVPGVRTAAARPL